MNSKQDYTKLRDEREMEEKESKGWSSINQV